jgi:hypothetical protein
MNSLYIAIKDENYELIQEILELHSPTVWNYVFGIFPVTTVEKHHYHHPDVVRFMTRFMNRDAFEEVLHNLIMTNNINFGATIAVILECIPDRHRYYFKIELEHYWSDIMIGTNAVSLAKFGVDPMYSLINVHQFDIDSIRYLISIGANADNALDKIGNCVLPHFPFLCKRTPVMKYLVPYPSYKSFIFYGCGSIEMEEMLEVTDPNRIHGCGLNALHQLLYTSKPVIRLNMKDIITLIRATEDISVDYERVTTSMQVFLPILDEEITRRQVAGINGMIHTGITSHPLFDANVLSLTLSYCK